MPKVEGAKVLHLHEYPRVRRLKQRKHRKGGVVTPQMIIDEYYRLQREKNIKLLDQKGFVTKVGSYPTLDPQHALKTRGEKEKEIQLNYDRYIHQMEVYRRRPVYFVKKELGINVKPFPDDLPPTDWKESYYNRLPLWTRQVEILNAIVEHRKVAVKSCHSSGKTYLAAIITIYLAYVYGALGITTAPTGRQVRRLLWAEIAKIWNYADGWQKSNGRSGLGGRLLNTSLELGDKWFVEGFSTDSKEANLPGFHAKTIFVIVDEAGGVDPKIFELLETVLSSEDVFVLYIGNPVDPNTEFKRVFDKGSEFYPITISAFDTPNVKHKKKIYPALCAHNWPRRMARKWGKNSAFYRSRVEGEFPLENIDGLIPYDKIIAAKERELTTDCEIIAIGADVARLGGDRAIAGRRYSNGHYREVISETKRRTTAFTGKLIVEWQVCNDHNKRIFQEQKDQRTDDAVVEEVNTPVLNIDDIGVGGGVTDMLLEEDLPANGINVAEGAEKGESADGQGKVKFKNKRAKYFWNLREAFMNDRVDIDSEDDELEQELLAIQVKYTSKGELQIIEKDLIKKKLNGRSPDKAEAMMLSFAETDFMNAANMIMW